MGALDIFHKGRVAPSDDSLIVKKGNIKKLAYKGDWESRKWNDRYLELRKGELRYYFTSTETKEIDTIEALKIQMSSMIVDDDTVQLTDPTTRRSMTLKLQSDLTLWDTICAIKKDYKSELQSAFIIQCHKIGQSNETNEFITKEHVFLCESVEEAKDWMDKINKMIEEVKPPPESWFGYSRRIVRKIGIHSHTTGIH